MDTITLGLFHTQEGAETAINELSRNGFSSKDISIVMQDPGRAETVSKTTGAHVEEGLLGRLIALGLPDEQARMYEIDIKTGAILLGVPTFDVSNMVRQIFTKHEAKQILSVHQNTIKI